MDVTCPKSQSWEVVESRLDSDPPNPSPVPFHHMSSQSLSFFLGKIIMSDNTPVPHWHWLYYVLFAHFTGYILTHDTSEVMGFCVMHLYLFVTSTNRLSHRMYAWFVWRNGCFGWDRWDRWASNMVIKFSHDTPPFSQVKAVSSCSLSPIFFYLLKCFSSTNQKPPLVLFSRKGTAKTLASSSLGSRCYPD